MTPISVLKINSLCHCPVHIPISHCMICTYFQQNVLSTNLSKNDEATGVRYIMRLSLLYSSFQFQSASPLWLFAVKSLIINVLYTVSLFKQRVLE